MTKQEEFKVEDDFLKSSIYESDDHISIKRQYDTLGNVMRWMSAYDQEDFDSLNINNYRKNHADADMDLTNRYPDGTVITGGGILCYFGPNRKDKAGFDDKRYPLSTPFIDVICDYAEDNWNDEVYVISYYSGLQGLLVSTVFDVKRKEALFSFASLEMYGDWRAR